MAAINKRRVLIGALAGGVVWNIWSMLLNMLFLAPHYVRAQESGLLLKEPRYPFIILWLATIFALAYIVAHLYAVSRATCGAGAKTALCVGLMVGFAAGFPGNMASATWSPLSRMLPLGWMLDLWIGAVLAALVAGYLYKD